MSQAKPKNSYGDIFRSSALVGGAQGVSLLIGMVRTKCVAYFLGPYGVGLNGNFQAIINLVTRFAGLGTAGSSIRNIASALKTGEDRSVGLAVSSLRTINLLMGVICSIAMAAFAHTISVWTFGDESQTWAVRILAVMIFVRNVTNIQSSIIQGFRRIDDLARLKIYAAIWTAIIAIGFYAAMGIKGIVPVILLNGLINCYLAWKYASKVSISKVIATTREYWSESRDMISVGVAMMWAGLLAAAVAWITRALITQQYDLDSVGFFQSSYRLSGMFVGFVLMAMAADFYPRLSEVKDDHPQMNRLVNEQTEIGLLLSLPGLMATLSLAPWIIYIFYTPQFLPAVDLLKWFILGCCCRVISWPMTYILLAKGKKAWMFVTDTMFHASHLCLIWFGLQYFDVLGVSIAFFIVYFLHVGAMLVVSNFLTGFRWSVGVARLLVVLAPVATGLFFSSQLLPDMWATMIGCSVTALTSIYCLREITSRLGPRNKVSRLLGKIPFGNYLIGSPASTTESTLPDNHEDIDS